MKTYQVWLVLEETEDDSPQNQIETYQLAVVKTEKEGRAVFEEAQEVLEQVKNNLPCEIPDKQLIDLVGAEHYQDFMDWLESKWMDVFANKETENSIKDLGYENVEECVSKFKGRDT